MLRTPKIEKMASGAYSCRIPDPLNPARRLRITDESPALVASRASDALATIRAVRRGDISPREGRLQLGRTVRGALKVLDVWLEWEKQQPPQQASNLRSMWSRRLAPQFGDLRIWEVDDAALALWEREQVRQGMKPGTIRVSFASLRSACKRAVESGVLSELPWRFYRPRRPARLHDATAVMSDDREACRNLDELERLVRAARAVDLDHAHRLGRWSDCAARILVITLCGLRQGEAAGLAWDRVGLEADPPFVAVDHQVLYGWHKRHPTWTRPQDPPKGGKRRRQVLHPSAVAALELQREALTRRGWYRPDGPVFPSPETGTWRLSPMAFNRQQFRSIVKAAGLANVDHWVPHSMRHTFSTLESTFGLLMARSDMRAVMNRTGHSSITVLQGYIHASGRGLPSSAIPELQADVLAPQLASVRNLQLAAGQREKRPSALALATSSTTAALVELARETVDAHDAPRVLGPPRKRHAPKKGAPNWADIAGAWLAGDRDGELKGRDAPAVVTTWAAAHYDRAYRAEMRKSGDKEGAARAGRRARRAFVASWARRLRVVGGEQPKAVVARPSQETAKATEPT